MKGTGRASVASQRSGYSSCFSTHFVSKTTVLSRSVPPALIGFRARIRLPECELGLRKLYINLPSPEYSFSPSTTIPSHLPLAGLTVVSTKSSLAPEIVCRVSDYPLRSATLRSIAGLCSTPLRRA
ncbi:hypothetical protein SISSUDRAFT_474351 [Sistotremastrum suecicum HHB10207 ss-3]|uniref:Uncharacterized protein n=1 Tax=Sistotremastrum suecicum HHB10207 ss-3 TaxID=1314776 RepID=A0A165Y3R1_9AGAM|nr:hypothetical protein SISSUDRAFT_474351 [Sistotremastrum suecicum HHB10207 ss-3]